MADERNGEDGRWDVGAKGGAVYVERRGEDGEQVFSDRLEPGDARQLAALLTKFAEKAESADSGETSKRDGDSPQRDEDSSDDSSDGGPRDDEAAKDS